MISAAMTSEITIGHCDLKDHGFSDMSIVKKNQLRESTVVKYFRNLSVTKNGNLSKQE